MTALRENFFDLSIARDQDDLTCPPPPRRRVRQPAAPVGHARGEPADPDPPPQQEEVPRGELGRHAVPPRGGAEKPEAGQDRAVVVAGRPHFGDPARGAGDGRAVAGEHGGAGPAPGPEEALGPRPRRLDEHGLSAHRYPEVRPGQGDRATARQGRPAGGRHQRDPDGRAAASRDRRAGVQQGCGPRRDRRADPAARGGRTSRRRSAR